MEIEIWRRGQVTKRVLNAFANGGKACTPLLGNLFGGVDRIPLTDDLAHKVLGAERLPCPHVGQEPLYGYSPGGYSAYSTSMGDGTSAINRRCEACGYSDYHNTGTRIHPERTYLKSPVYSRAFTHADWNDAFGGFDLPLTDGRIILWQHSPLSTCVCRAREAFPEAIIVGEEERYIILREPSSVAVDDHARTH